MVMLEKSVEVLQCCDNVALYPVGVVSGLGFYSLYCYF